MFSHSKRNKLNLAASLACVFSLFLVRATFAVDIPNTRVVFVPNHEGTVERNSSNMVNGTGLSGGTHDSGNPRHGWLTGGGAVADADIIFQLPQNYTVSNIHVWNYSEGSGNRGLNSVDIYTSNVDSGPVSTFVGNFSFPSASGANAGFDLTGLGWTPQANVRRILFDTLTNHGDGRAGLEEVRFQTTATIPSGPTPDLSGPIAVAGVTSTGEYPTRTAAATIDGSGLSGAFPNEVHANSPEPDQMWRNSDGTRGQQNTLTYDLGGLHNLGGIKIWDYIEGQINGQENMVTQLNIEVSKDGNSYSNLGDFTIMGLPAPAEGIGTTYPGNFLDLSTATDLSLLNGVQFVRLKVLSTAADRPDGDTTIENSGGGFIDMGIAEVQFFDAVDNVVPEPSTYALGLIGLAGLGLFAWRRRRRG